MYGCSGVGAQWAEKSWSFFFTSRRRHTRWPRDWSSDVCSSDLGSESGAKADSLPEAGDQTASPSDKKDGKKESSSKRKKRSEERRVGKESRNEWRRSREKRKNREDRRSRRRETTKRVDTTL